jgi:hypothetical protein
MRRSRFTEEQIIGVLREREAGVTKPEQIASLAAHQHRLLIHALTSTNRIVGRVTALHSASASAASDLPRFTHGFT